MVADRKLPPSVNEKYKGEKQEEKSKPTKVTPVVEL